MIAITSLILGCCALLVLAGFFGVRNEWVFRQRAKLIDAHFSEVFSRLDRGDHGPFPEWDENLPSYDRMMYRYFWIWDINKMRGRR
jgi:hypothetical protein